MHSKIRSFLVSSLNIQIGVNEMDHFQRSERNEKKRK